MRTLSSIFPVVIQSATSSYQRVWGIMKKYVLFGLIAGVTISVLAVYFRRKRLAGTEFYGFFDSSAVADELFGDAFEELPDKP
ncbi:MAG: hypothetical protein AABZ02_13175 [Bacteroidota bacterium]